MTSQCTPTTTVAILDSIFGKFAAHRGALASGFDVSTLHQTPVAWVAGRGCEEMTCSAFCFLVAIQTTLSLLLQNTDTLVRSKQHDELEGKRLEVNFSVFVLTTGSLPCCAGTQRT